MRILFLAFELPYPLDRGGRIKSYHFLKGLSYHHETTLVAITRSPDETRYINALKEFCAEVYTILIPISRMRKISRAVTSLPGSVPFIVSLYSSQEMQHLLSSLLTQGNYDVIYAEHFHMSQYVPTNSSPVKVLDQHNVESVILRRFFESQPLGPIKIFAWLEWRKMLRYEPWICRNFDRILAVTNVDKEIMRPWLRPEQSISVIPIGVDTAYFQPQNYNWHSKELISVGTMYWKPNVDGILWFHDTVYPRVKERVPDVKLTIVGTRPPAEIVRLAKDDRVTVTGWVEDVRPYMARSVAMVVPLHVGSGMRVKILNALAMGLPVVSTSVGCEGIDVTDGENILIADDPAGFAEAITRLLGDRDLRQRLSEQGRALAVERYSWDRIYTMIGEVFAEIDEALTN